MPRAYCLIRSEPHYRRNAFMSGLKAAGYDARTGGPNGVNPGDVVVMWNRYNENHDLACRIERQGGIVLIAENAYVHSRLDGGTHYALAKHAHNGRGEWAYGGLERWQSFGIPLKPWRTEGGHILVAPNRGFGQPGGIMHPGWARNLAARLKAVTDREIRIREHPGNGKPKVPLSADLEGAWCVAVWSSSVGVRALIEGVPVLCESPYWICKSAALSSVQQVTNPPLDDSARLDALSRMAWAQFSVEEIASGMPFDLLCSTSTAPDIAGA